MSGGEQQRIALARALAAEVGLILFDEPLSNLDADRREQLRIEIATLTREAGATAIYITHDQFQAFALADQIGVLDQGRLIQLDSPETIYRQPATAFVARFTGIAGEFPVHVLGETSERRAAGVTLAAPTHDEGVRGSIRDVAFKGHGYDYVVDVGDGYSLTKVYSSTKFDRRQNVKVCFDTKSCFVMDSSREANATW